MERKNIKKVLLSLIIFVVFLLLGCSSPSNDETISITETNNKSDSKITEFRIIKPSELISKENAETILGMNLQADPTEVDVELTTGILQSSYSSEEYILSFTITQDALIPETRLEYGNSMDKFNALVKYQKEDYPENIILVEDIGDEAYFVDLADDDRWSIHILKDGYDMNSIIYGVEDSQLAREKLKEIGKIAMENYKTINR